MQERLEWLEKLLRQRAQEPLLCEAVSLRAACGCPDNNCGCRDWCCWMGKIFSFISQCSATYTGLCCEGMCCLMAKWPLASTIKTYSYTPATSHGYSVYDLMSKKVQIPGTETWTQQLVSWMGFVYHCVQIKIFVINPIKLLPQITSHSL